MACQSNVPEASVNAKQSVEISNNITNVKNKIFDDPAISVDYLMGKFDPKTDSRFVEIDTKHADRPNLLLRSEAYTAFLEMLAAAQKDGISFTIKSATRNFDYQKGIWERKWNGKTTVDGLKLNESLPDPHKRALKILEYSSMPGSSRHHWGTDLDINSFDNNYFEQGKGLAEYNWLVQNAHRFGFCQPYSPKDSNRPNGYQEEKWHWSFLPLSKTFTQQAELKLRDEMISGFDGAQAALSIGLIRNYVLGINKECYKFK